MGKQSIAISFITLLSLGTKAQTNVIKTNFDIQLGTSKAKNILNGVTNWVTTGNGINVTLNPAFGKIKKETDLLFYGIILTFQRGSGKDINQNKSTNYKLGIGANIGKQKFIELIPKLYYCPQLNFGILYQYGRNKTDNNLSNDFISHGYNASINFLPFSVGIKIKKNLMVAFNIGQLGMAYGMSREKSENSGNDIFFRTSNFSITANSNSYTIALIYSLNQK